MLRPLFLVWPDDQAAVGVEDQFMFGDALLVAPVLARGALTRLSTCQPGVVRLVDWGTAYGRSDHHGGCSSAPPAPVCSRRFGCAWLAAAPVCERAAARDLDAVRVCGRR